MHKPSKLVEVLVCGRVPWAHPKDERITLAQQVAQLPSHICPAVEHVRRCLALRAEKAFGTSVASGAADGAKASGPRLILPHKAQQARAGNFQASRALPCSNQRFSNPRSRLHSQTSWPSSRVVLWLKKAAHLIASHVGCTPRSASRLASLALKSSERHGLREAVVVLSVLSETETFVEASLHMLNAVSRGDLGYDPELSIIASDRYW